MLSILAALVVGLVATVAGAIVGGVAGSSAGAAGDGLIRQARAGDPLCTSCALKVAGFSAAIEVAPPGFPEKWSPADIAEAGEAVFKKQANGGVGPFFNNHNGVNVGIFVDPDTGKIATIFPHNRSQP